MEVTEFITNISSRVKDINVLLIVYDAPIRVLPETSAA